MSRVDELPADRRAVLQLLLKQGKSYEDLAGLLRIEPATVRERARDALGRLGPADSGGLEPARRDEVADYLLGQQSATARADTRGFLEDSPEARGWAHVVAGELRSGALASDDLPEIPAGRREADEPVETTGPRREARTRHQRSSRLGGVILLLGVAVAIIVIVLVASGVGGTDRASTPVAVTTARTTSTTAQDVAVLGQANLTSPDSKALAAVQLVRQGTEVAMLFQGQGIPQRPANSVFAMWLTATGRAPVRLGFIDRQTPKSGKLQFSGALPVGIDPTQYDHMLVTRETTSKPTTPGLTVMSGDLVKAPA
jgi:Anti-sigma-K factor rskA